MIKLKEMTDFVYGKNDLEAIKKLNDFLPDRLFDSHMHISHVPALGVSRPLCYDDYILDVTTLIGNRKISVNMIPAPTKDVRTMEQRRDSVSFISSQLDRDEGSVGEIFVMPNDTSDYIESQLTDKRIKGFKCYHIYADRKDTFNAEIEEYLPEAALEVANKHGLAITLHMVRDLAIADDGNRKYIKEMAQKYPNAKLILAHAARAFAAWTAIEHVNDLQGLDNIYFDFAGVCESPAMTYILKNFGPSRCMWGTDWPISMKAGKCVSLGDNFYWINEKDLRSFKSATPLHSRLVGTESLMATREACIIAGLGRKDIEDLFYNTAHSLFSF